MFGQNRIRVNFLDRKLFLEPRRIFRYFLFDENRVFRWVTKNSIHNFSKLSPRWRSMYGDSKPLQDSELQSIAALPYDYGGPKCITSIKFSNSLIFAICISRLSFCVVSVLFLYEKFPKNSIKCRIFVQFFTHFWNLPSEILFFGEGVLNIYF